MSFDEVAEEDEEIGQVRVFGRSLSLIGIDFWRIVERVPRSSWSHFRVSRGSRF